MITYSDLLIWSAHELCCVTHPVLGREVGMGELRGREELRDSVPGRGRGAGRSCPSLPRSPALGGRKEGERGGLWEKPMNHLQVGGRKRGGWI